jgi:hypothetical protein
MAASNLNYTCERGLAEMVFVARDEIWQDHEMCFENLEDLATIPIIEMWCFK